MRMNRPGWVVRFLRGSTVSRSDRFLFWMAEGNRSALLPLLETSAPLRATTGVHSHARAHGNPRVKSVAVLVSVGVQEDGIG